MRWRKPERRRFSGQFGDREALALRRFAFDGGANECSHLPFAFAAAEASLWLAIPAIMRQLELL